MTANNAVKGEKPAFRPTHLTVTKETDALRGVCVLASENQTSLFS